MTRVDAVPPARTGGDVVNLDFCGESYNVDFDYSRASSASYLGRNINQFGQYEYLLKNDFVGDVENLILYSEQLTQSAWIKRTNIEVIKFNLKYKDSQVFKLIDNGSGDDYLSQEILISNDSSIIIFSTSIKKTEHENYVSLWSNMNGGTAQIAIALVETSTGTITPGGTATDLSCIYHDGFWNINLSNKNNSSGNDSLQLRIYPAYNAGSGGRVSKLEGTILLTRLSVTLGSNIKPYVKTLNSSVTKSFTSNPRIEYDFNTKKCLGYLSEGSVTNLYINSQDISVASLQNVTVISNVVQAPDFTLSADRVNDDTNNTTHRVNKNITVVSGIPHTLSFFAKKGANLNFVFCGGITGADSVDSDAYFNLNTGEIVGGGVSTTMEYFGNGWYRCSKSYVTTATTARPVIFLCENSASITYQGDNGFIYLWGVQFENVEIATSYIKTGSSSVTRAGEFLKIRQSLQFTRSGFATNYSNIHLKIDRVLSALADRSVLGSTGQGNSNFSSIFIDSNNSNKILFRYGSASALAIDNTNRADKFKIASTFNVSLNLLSVYQDGELKSTKTTSREFEPNISEYCHIGSNGTNGHLFGHIKNIIIYNISLTADEVKSL
jgi:hypothetical protein